MSGPGETADRSRASDAVALPYAVSAEDGGNPFAREGGSYDSVRPAYPDEAVAALLGAASRSRGRGAAGQAVPREAAWPAPESPCVPPTLGRAPAR